MKNNGVEQIILVSQAPITQCVVINARGDTKFSSGFVASESDLMHVYIGIAAAAKDGNMRAARWALDNPEGAILKTRTVLSKKLIKE